MDSLGASVVSEFQGSEPNNALPRILHVSTRHVLGGGGRNLNFTMSWERRAGYEVHLVVGTEHPVAVPEGVRLHVVPALRRALSPPSDLRACYDLRRLIRAHRYDMVNTHQSKAGIIGRLAARGLVPVLAHTIHMASFGTGYPAVQSLAFRTLERHCGRFTDLFVAVGHDIKNRYVRAGIGHDYQYLVVRSPIDVHHMAEVRTLSDPERALRRARLGLPQSVRVIASVGLLEPRKRIALLIRGLAPLLHANTDVFLAIAGTGPEEMRLRSLSAELGLESRIRFLGWIGDVADLLAVTSLLVQTSSAEGVSQVIIQALAAGVPVVATDVEGLHEIAGAPITVVDRRARGLLPSCNRVLIRGGRPTVAIEHFSDWTQERVTSGLSEVHKRAGDVLVKRSTVPR